MHVGMLARAPVTLRTRRVTVVIRESTLGAFKSPVA
jgi:hypothetical protein